LKIKNFDNTTAGSHAIEAVGTTGNGLVAVNSVTDHSAAAVSAIPGGTSALAYWGGGGIQLTGSFAEKVGGGSWSAPSDARLKKDVKGFTRGLSDLLKLRPVTFKYNGLGGTEDNNEVFVGVIAQELEKVLPEMVTSRKGKLYQGDKSNTDIKHVDPSEFMYVLINAVQEQQKTIQQQEARIAVLEGKTPHVLSSSILPLGGLGLLPVALWFRRRKSAQS